jgi:hypothetical protein
VYGGSPGCRPSRWACVVLDAGAEAHLREELQVVEGALLEPLRLEELPRVAQDVEALLQLGADRVDGALERRRRRDVVARGVDLHLVDAAEDGAPERVDLADRVDGVAEELDADRARLFVRGIDLDDVAAHAERAPREVVVVRVYCMSTSFRSSASRSIVSPFSTTTSMSKYDAGLPRP